MLDPLEMNAKGNDSFATKTTNTKNLEGKSSGLNKRGKK